MKIINLLKVGDRTGDHQITEQDLEDIFANFQVSYRKKIYRVFLWEKEKYVGRECPDKYLTKVWIYKGMLKGLLNKPFHPTMNDCLFAVDVVSKLKLPAEQSDMIKGRSLARINVLRINFTLHNENDMRRLIQN